jgi:hypothetical protein
VRHAMMAASVPAMRLAEAFGQPGAPAPNATAPAAEAASPFLRRPRPLQMINHHDGFDMFDSTYQPWNSVKVGPKKDLAGGLAKAARDAGLRENFPREVAKVELLGAGPVTFARDASGLVVNMPEKKPNDYAYALKVTPK